MHCYCHSQSKFSKLAANTRYKISAVRSKVETAPELCITARGAVADGSAKLACTLIWRQPYDAATDCITDQHLATELQRKPENMTFNADGIFRRPLYG